MPTELSAALFQGLVTAGTAGVCWYLYRRYRRPDFLWWTVAWWLYVARILAIVAFLVDRGEHWLFAHQILTGYTALAVLWAALTFSRSASWRPAFALALLFPPTWSWVAIYQLDNFLLAALPAVLFLSFATFWTGWVFLRHWRQTGSRGSATLAAVLLTWGLHHLDYPVMRAMGSWNPWGYYIDILFVLAIDIGIVFLVLEALDRRTGELERLSARIVRQHEEERGRISLELHDQTAQVWAGVKMQLGVVREMVPSDVVPRLDRVLTLVDTGIKSIRSVTTNLRPPLLDDLGLVPALRALVKDFGEQAELSTAFDGPEFDPPVNGEAALALYRALQEGLSNVARHSGATEALVRLDVSLDELTLSVQDNGIGLSSHSEQDGARRLGLAGMRERVGSLGGSVELNASASSGAALTVKLPLNRVI